MPEEPPLLVLTGTVRSPDGLAVEGARVVPALDSWLLRGRDGMPLARDLVDRARPTVKEARTGADGRYTIEVRLPFGVSLPVQVSAEGFLPIDRGILALEQNLARPHDFVLERAVGIEGRVVDQEGAPVSGASVGLRETAGGSRPTGTQTNYDGRFVLPDVPARAWTLDVRGGRLPEGLRWKRRSHRRIVHGGDRNIEVVVEHSPLAGARVLLEVLDGQTGEPVEPAETSLNPVEGEPLEWTQRDSGIRVSKGSLRIDVVEPGRWIAWVRLRDGRVGWARFDVGPSGTEVRGRIEVGDTGSIGGKVDLGGMTLGPRDRLQVEASFHESLAFPQFATTGNGTKADIRGHAWVNADGSFVVQGLLPGRYELHAWARGVSALGAAEVHSNRRASAELVATKCGVLRFRLSRGVPPCKLQVLVLPEGRPTARTGITVERPVESEWTQDVEIHPGTYAWSAAFGHPADRHSLLQAARPASGTVTVGSGETVEVVIPVAKDEAQPQTPR